MGPSNRPWLLLVVLALAPGCRDVEPVSDPASPSITAGDAAGAPAAEAATAPGPDALERAVGLTFGLPLPVGLELAERDDDVALFRSPHAIESLVAFYDRELPDHVRTDGADGTKYDPSDDGTAVFIVTDPGAPRVVYVRETIDLTVLEVERAAPAVGRVNLDAESYASRYPWGQGLHIPAQHIDRALASHGRGRRVSGGGLFYVESFEEVDGERVRVLTLRELPDDTLLEGEATADSEGSERPAHWHRLPRRPGGSYDRGDGERSLRPSPELDDDGQPLPFYGTQRLDIDRDAVRH